MSKKTIQIGLLFALLIMPLISVTAKEETLGDLRKKYEALLQEQRDNEAKSEAAKKEAEAKERAKQAAEEKLTQAKKR